jgi:hypothetical protein
MEAYILIVRPSTTNQNTTWETYGPFELKSDAKAAGKTVFRMTGRGWIICELQSVLGVSSAGLPNAPKIIESQ